MQTKWRGGLITVLYGNTLDKSDRSATSVLIGTETTSVPFQFSTPFEYFFNTCTMRAVLISSAHKKSALPIAALIKCIQIAHVHVLML